MIKFITLTNSGYKDYTLNCLKSLERIKCPQTLHSYCIGKDGYDILKSKKYDCTLIDDEKNSNFQTFRNGNWSNITYYKFKIIHDNLLTNEYVCFTDGDIIYRNNKIFNYLLDNIGDNDLLIQNELLDDNNDKTLGSGFMFIKSNPNTISIFNPDEVESFKDTLGWDDEVYVNEVKNKLKFKMLPLKLFPNGKYFYENSKKINPYLIHFNWIVGDKKKRQMVYFGGWYLPLSKEEEEKFNYIFRKIHGKDYIHKPILL